jgi:hypothetical protein
MAETAYFYWPKISFEELDELVSSLRDPTVDKNLKVRETYLMRTKNIIIEGSSVLELRKNVEIYKMNLGKQIKLSNLNFKLESRDGIISFDGDRHKRRITFEERKITKQWEKKKKEKFVKFWKKDYIRRATSRKTRLARASGALGSFGLMLSSGAATGAIISYFVLKASYRLLNAWYGSFLLILELSAPFSLAFIIVLASQCIELKSEEYSYDRHLKMGKNTFWGIIESHFSVVIEMSFIPLIYLIYNDYSIMTNINVLSYALIKQTIDLNALEVIWAISLSIFIGFLLTLLKNFVARSVYIGRLTLRK